MLTRILVCLSWLAFAGSAQAYCRTHTMDPAASECPEPCPDDGIPLAWTTPHLTYAFNVNGFPNIADADLRRMIADSIGAWEAVTCEGKSIGFDSVANPDPTTLTLGPEATEPNENVIVYFTIDEWDDNDLGSSAYATTQVWFDTRTGEIIGADMMFNGSMGPFGECPDTGCTADGPRVDIRNVATHEFGHFLGLAHTEVETATMYCNAVPREISKRMLAPDDIAGLCAAYPPGEAFKSDTSTSSNNSSGCALGPEAGGGALLLALLLWRRRRPRPSSPRG